MKQVNPSRFKKEEEIDFQAEPIVSVADQSQKPPLVKQQASPPPKATERTPVRTQPIVYRVLVPQKRVRIRHAFDIYEDELDALKKIQSAHRDTHGNAGTPSLSDMAREAFDALIKERVKGMKNIDIAHE